jgi:acetylornithine deacetylase/succinyl-diaminopimelate desuccinylase-like protein
MQRTVSWLSAAISLAAILLLVSARPPAGNSKGHDRKAAARADVAPEWPKLDEEAVKDLSEYIRVDTSNPPGNEVRAVDWFKKIFDEEGIPYDTAESAAGRGNIVARLKSSKPNGEPALILLNHMDVVPVSREYWTVDPFAGLLRDGYVWGRGAEDMKSTGIAQLMVFLELHRAQVPLRRDVIFLGTADEEAGGLFGPGWLLKNKPEWTAGAGFLLTEGANTPAGDSGQAIYYGVGPTEKTPAWLKLTATGHSGHGSVPIPDSAVNRLLVALNRLREYRPPLEVTPPVESSFRTLAPYETGAWRSRYENIRAFIASPGAYEELQKRPATLALLTNTIAITGLEGTKKVNIIPPAASALLDCRLLPGWTIERWREQVKKILQDDSIQIETILNFAPATSSVDTPLYSAIVDAVKRMHPEAGVAQTIETGFTDSHYFREHGIVSYGFEPFPLTGNDTSRVHGNDERIPAKAFTDGVHLTWEVVYNFSREP